MSMIRVHSSSPSAAIRFPSIATLLKSCRNQTHLHQVHAHIIHKGLEQDNFLISILISLSNSLFYSATVFNRVVHPNTVLWNCLIKGYSQKYFFLETFSLFTRMKRSDASPDKYTYPLVIKVCATERKAKIGCALHGSALRCGVDGDVYVGTSLVDFYGKCNDMLCARKVFDEMFERNVVSWTALFVGYIGVGDFVEAKKVFDGMPERNLASWNAMIDGLVKVGDLRNARRIFDEMSEKNAVSYTVMIDGYAKAGDMASARFLFEQAPEIDIVAWSALMSGYAQNGQPTEALKIFVEMDSRKIKADEFIMVSLMAACSQLSSLELAKWVDRYLCQSSINLRQSHVMSALIDMNAKCGNMDRAIALFEEMPKRDLVSYCSLIQGLSIHGHGHQAVALFNRMIDEGLTPDNVAFTVILAACSCAGLVEEGLRFFESMQNKYSMAASHEHYSCIIDLLGRSGRLKEAYELIESMPLQPQASVWGALLGACKLHCNIELGKVVADKLFQLEPQNAGTYVLLSDMYAAENRWPEVFLLRKRMEEIGARKIRGCSWIEGFVYEDKGKGKEKHLGSICRKNDTGDFLCYKGKVFLFKGQNSNYDHSLEISNGGF